MTPGVRQGFLTVPARCEGFGFGGNIQKVKRLDFDGSLMGSIPDPIRFSIFLKNLKLLPNKARPWDFRFSHHET